MPTKTATINCSRTGCEATRQVIIETPEGTEIENWMLTNTLVNGGVSNPFFEQFTPIVSSWSTKRCTDKFGHLTPDPKTVKFD